MSSFDTALQAFQESRLSFAELLALTKQLGSLSPSAVAEARQRVEREYGSGKLPAQVYFALQAAMDDETRIAVSGPGSTVTPNQYDEATRLATGQPSPASTVIPPPAFAAQPPQVTPPTPTSLPTQPSPTTQPTVSLLNTESLLSDGHASTPTELGVGSTLKNRFVLQQLLGVGGMGMVFKATDLRKIEAADKDPFVALKVLNQDFQANPMALMALQRESKRAQTLAHPNIIKVYDFDRDGAHVFMSMEYLEGRPLSHLIREHASRGLPFKQAWPIIHAMAEALGHAHSKNIVHSDFKPGNVFINDAGEVRVLDFGIACAIGRGDKDKQDATVFNARSLGALTPAYASLEQLQNRNPDPRDDIYALACVTYELLTGKHPFGRLSAEKALEVNLEAKPVPNLGRRQWKGLQKALALQQDQRCATIDEFLSAIGPRSAVFYGLWGTGMVAVGLVAVNIYIGMIAPPTVIEAPKVAIELNPEQQQKIKDLLELAEIHFDVGYLTAPTGSNALWAYQEVLKIDPYNNLAVNGINKIADTLEQQAWEAYEKGDRSEALKKVQEGLEANPGHKGLLNLKDKLRAAS